MYWLLVAPPPVGWYVGAPPVDPWYNQPRGESWGSVYTQVEWRAVRGGRKTVGQARRV